MFFEVKLLHIPRPSFGGWMGIFTPEGRINMRNLDPWRVEKGLIRGNWVLEYFLDGYQQIGVNVFECTREFKLGQSCF